MIFSQWGKYNLQLVTASLQITETEESCECEILLSIYLDAVILFFL